MIDVKEHFYDDDPSKGHPDVCTKLGDVSYFFLGNGYIQAAVQIAPSEDGTPIGLLIMNPELLGKKREALTCDPESGLENTMIRIILGTSVKTAETETLEFGWFYEYKIPAVRVQWCSDNFRVTEYFYCPDMSHPVLIREVWIKNITQQPFQANLHTGVVHKTVGQEFTLQPKGEERIFLRYALDSSGKQVNLDLVLEGGVRHEALQYWREKAHASFGTPC